MLSAGEAFRDVCACRRPRGSFLEPWWDGVLDGGLFPSPVLAKHSVPSPGMQAVAMGWSLSRCWYSLIKWVHHGLGVENTQLASRKERGVGLIAGGDAVGIPTVPLDPCPSRLAMTLMQWGLCFNLVGWCLVSVPDANGGGLLWAFAYSVSRNHLFLLICRIEEGWDHCARGPWLEASDSCSAALPDEFYRLNTMQKSQHIPNMVMV